MEMDNKGHTLVEALAAILIFTLGSIVMLTMFSAAKRMNLAARDRDRVLSQQRITWELGTEGEIPGTVTITLGARSETVAVQFSGEEAAVFFPAEGGDAYE